MNANNRFNASSLDKDYRLKGFDGVLREALIGKLLLERTIRRMSSPHTVSIDGAIILICPLCDSHESVKMPIELVELVTLTNNFLNVHGNTCKKQTDNPQEFS